MAFRQKITTGIFTITDVQKRDVEALNRLLKSKEKTSKVSKGVNVVDRYSAIRTQINQVLGTADVVYDCIRTEAELSNYVQSCIANGIYAIDTETTSLDPITTTLVGFSLFTPGRNPVYIPVNHIGYVTQVRLDSQVTEQQAKTQLQNLLGCKAILHNAKFDIRVLKATLGIEIVPFWDTMLGAKLIKEDESAALKYQYAKVFEGKAKKEYDFDSLFGGLDFRAVPLDIASVYGAADAYKTYMLYEYQKQWFDSQDNIHVKSVMQNIEMPLINCIADMEDTGIALNVDTCTELSVKYHERAEQYKKECERIINEQYGQLIAEFRIKNVELGSKLSNPVAITSPQQLAILIYDIAKIQSPDSRNPRGTGEDIITMLGDKLPFGKALLEYRHNLKLLSTYIDKLPECVNTKTNKIHASFHQYGAATGRFSSSDPNLQNIPARGEAKEIRHIFTASKDVEVIKDCYEDTIVLGVKDIVPTQRGDVEAGKLVQNDILLFEGGQQRYVRTVEIKGSSAVQISW